MPTVKFEMALSGGLLDRDPAQIASSLAIGLRRGMREAVDLGKTNLAENYGAALRSGPGRYGHLADPGGISATVSSSNEEGLIVGTVRPRKFTAAIFEYGARPHHLGERFKRGKWRRIVRGRVSRRNAPAGILSFVAGGHLIFRTNPTAAGRFASHPGVSAHHVLADTAAQMTPDAERLIEASVLAALNG